MLDLQRHKNLQIPEPEVKVWPSPQDFNESIQNPLLNLSDPELQLAEPVLNSLGLPKPASGNFASVYQMQNGRSSWAVRCFLHPVAGLEQRYSVLATEFERIARPYLAGFEYQTQGIKVGSQWYPILKMEWVEGSTLQHFITKNIADSSALHSLTERFHDLVLDMNTTGIAHGDLQHGNIMVEENGNLRLVDYDACFVKKLAGLNSNELGHRNYQHPQRSKEHFDTSLDNFSAWFIWLNLRMLALDSTLWSKFEGGEDCLLFRQKDFLNPEYSRTFHLLEHHPEEEIRALSKYLRHLLRTAPENIPGIQTEFIAPEDLPLLQTVLARAKKDQTSAKAMQTKRHSKQELLEKRVLHESLQHFQNNRSDKTIEFLLGIRNVDPAIPRFLSGSLSSLIAIFMFAHSYHAPQPQEVNHSNKSFAEAQLDLKKNNLDAAIKKYLNALGFIDLKPDKFALLNDRDLEKLFAQNKLGISPFQQVEAWREIGFAEIRQHHNLPLGSKCIFHSALMSRQQGNFAESEQELTELARLAQEYYRFDIAYQAYAKSINDVNGEEKNKQYVELAVNMYVQALQNQTQQQASSSLNETTPLKDLWRALKSYSGNLQAEELNAIETDARDLEKSDNELSDELQETMKGLHEDEEPQIE